MNRVLANFFVVNKLTLNLIYLSVAAGIFAGASECQAQRFGGVWRRSARIHRTPVVHNNYEALSLQSGQNDFDAVQRSTKSFFKSVADGRNYDPRTNRLWDSDPRYPKYIGGFHSSHFSNVGLPSGDIGFRGNGIYWTPW